MSSPVGKNGEPVRRIDDDVLATRSTRARHSLTRIAFVSSVAAGIQFGWALQLSLLTPYIQTLGIPHEWASFIWLCGPISGLLVQPVVGVWSDNCKSSWGRRRPFILAGAIFIVLAIFLIGYSADLGFALGDDQYLDGSTRPYACALFIIGFWCLDLSNNTVQGPSRALLADLAAPDQMDAANAFYSLWIALGNIAGYSAGATDAWSTWFPFLTSTACGSACANLKAAFLLAILFLICCTTVTLVAAEEVPLSSLPDPTWEPLAPELQGEQGQEPQGPGHDLSGSLEDSHCMQHASHFTAGMEVEDEEEETASSCIQLTVLGSSAQSQQKGSEQQESRVEVQDAERSSEAAGFGMSWRLDGYRKVVGGDQEEQQQQEEEGEKVEGAREAAAVGDGTTAQPAPSTSPGFLATLQDMPSSMHAVLLVMALTWMAWFPFLLFDTDWMGREVYQGVPAGDPDVAALYQKGVREGALGLLLNSVVQAIMSTRIDYLCKKFSPRAVWAAGNFIIFGCMVCTFLVTISAVQVVIVGHGQPPIVHHPQWVKGAAVAVFAVLGAPFAITLSVPYSMTAELAAGRGGGQGLAMGILNMAIVTPQIVVSLGAGPWDALFGGGNEPAFALAAVFALAGSVCAWKLLPNTRSSSRIVTATPHF